MYCSLCMRDKGWGMHDETQLRKRQAKLLMRKSSKKNPSLKRNRLHFQPSSSYFKHWNSMKIDQVTWLRNFTIIPRMFINPYSKYSNPTQNMASSRFFQVAATSNLNSNAKYRILYHTILVLSTTTSWHNIRSFPLKSDFKNKDKIISRKDTYA